jgi:uncharacterized membrane protein
MLLPSLTRGLPDPLPTHFNAQGQPNGWTSLHAFPWLALGLPALIWLVFLLLGWVARGTDQDPDGRKAVALAPLRGCLVTGIEILALSPLAIARVGMAGLWISLAVFVLCTATGAALMARKLQQDGPAPLHAEHYRWGFIYVNAEDPSIWVPKQLGIGWTLNFAHPISWFFLILLLAPVLILIAFQLLA